jgi:hypothetical protein
MRFHYARRRESLALKKQGEITNKRHWKGEGETKRLAMNGGNTTSRRVKKAMGEDMLEQAFQGRA